MINYIKHYEEGSLLFIDNYVQKARKSSLSIVKLLCEHALFSYDSRVNMTKKHFSLWAKVPIYIHDSLVLIPTKSPRNYDNQWINYCAVKRYEKSNDRTIVLLSNQIEISLEVSYQAFHKKMKLCQEIIDYLEDLEQHIYF